jgi:hypothetical protein
MFDQELLRSTDGDEVHLFVPDSQFPVIEVKKTQGPLFERDMDGRCRVFKYFKQVLIHIRIGTRMDSREQLKNEGTSFL